MTQESSRHAIGPAAYLAIIQFFFFLSWTIYVIYLGPLLDQLGIGREWIKWLILADQVVFVIMSAVMGFAADRVERQIGRLGPFILGFNAIACLAFAGLPLIPALSDGQAAWPKLVFLMLIIVWVATSSVLRAPPMALLFKRAAQPQVPRLVAINLTGLALAGALSPYFGQLLANVDPLLPFLITSLALWLTTLGLIWMERWLRSNPEPPPSPALPPTSLPVLLLLGIGFALALGFQLHFFFAVKPRLLEFIEPGELSLYMPVFWIGFNIFVYLAPELGKRLGGPRTALLGCAIGIVGFVGHAWADSLALVSAAQLLTGAAWGTAFATGISTAVQFGRSSKEGLMLGLWFSALALAAVFRVGLALADVSGASGQFGVADLGPILLWILGAGLLLVLVGKAREAGPA